MKLYFEAEQFLRTNGPASGSLQSRIFNDKKLTNSPKHVYAVVYSTLKYKPYIMEVIRKAKLKQAMVKPRASDELLMLLVHDLLFSPKGRIQSGKHPLKDAFLKHRTRLSAEFTKLKLRYKVKAAAELPTEEADGDETPVRWFRANPVRCDPDKLQQYSWFSGLTRVDSIGAITAPGVVYYDDYIPHLYGVHPREKITSTAAYADGEIIIQDRASCFPAHILNEVGAHQHIIDACAAPGNKTTHNAAYAAVAADAVVYAFERDQQRVKVLKTMCDKATGSRRDLIQVTHADFTTTAPSDFAAVTGLTVDPSCSGSGIFGRALEEQDKEEIDTDRLNKLAGFQFKIVKHALSFPAARRVVYSTCSVHPHENERVVVDLLRDSQVSAQGWRLEDRSRVLSEWPRRGWKEEFTALAEGDDVRMAQLAGGCVRAVPKEDGGIGFFAACFTRDLPENSSEADGGE